MKTAVLLVATVTLLQANVTEKIKPPCSGRIFMFCKNLDLKTNKTIQVNTQLVRLSIYNSTGSIGANTFRYMPQLSSISISYSDISYVEDGALCLRSRIHSLNLHHIDHFPILTQSLLSNCDKIRFLSIGWLQLESNALKNMVNLEDLYMSNLHIPHLTKEYLGSLQNLNNLTFYNCEIEKIDPGALCMSPSLDYVTMERTKNLTSLKRSMLENCSNINSFWFEGDGQTNIEEDAVGGLAKLKRLQLTKINIGHLKRGLLGRLQNLEILDLSDAKIVKIDPDFFSDFDRLEHLYLSNNNLTEVDYTAVIRPLPNLIRLDLKNTNLPTLDNISHLNLTDLRISGNSISKIDPTTVQENFPRLQLCIAWNDTVHEEEMALETELQTTTDDTYITSDM